MENKVSLDQNLATCNTEFALDLYRLFDEKDNIFFSPAGINLSLAMVRLGAENRTRDQLTKGLHLNRMKKEEDIWMAYGQMMESLNQQGKCYRTGDLEFILRTANRMYVEQSYPIINIFDLLVRQIFKSDIEKLDFKYNRVKSAAEINKWVEEYTNSKIKSIVDPGGITFDTSVILVNAVYFYGTWDEHFCKSETKPMDFHSSLTRSSKVDMMYVKKKFCYAESAHSQLDCKVLDLPYRSHSTKLRLGLGMMILLPNQVDGIDKMVSKLNSQMIEELSKDMTFETVTVRFPKFKLETNYNLTSALGKLGMEDLFSENDADLRALSGTKELYVSAVMHKTFLSVDEKGTEAVAVTYNRLRGGGVNQVPRPEVEFIADHPFVFLIRDKNTGLVVFMGCFRKPVPK